MARASLGFGVHIDRPITGLQSSYLLWVCSQGALRNKYPDSIRVALAELRSRLAEPGRIESELLSDVPTAARDLI